jgi:hypothetical protein
MLLRGNAGAGIASATYEWLASRKKEKKSQEYLS